MSERLDAVVAGGGAAGLAAAAMLRKAGVEAPVLERTGEVGSSWRGRYDALRLNTLRWSSALPGYKLDRRYGRWPSRDDWVAYLERYTEHHLLDVRYGTELRHVERDGADWRLETSEGSLLTRNVVLALGLDHDPVVPDWPGRDQFAGELFPCLRVSEPEAVRGS